MKISLFIFYRSYNFFGCQIWNDESDDEGCCCEDDRNSVSEDVERKVTVVAGVEYNHKSSVKQEALQGFIFN